MHPSKGRSKWVIVAGGTGAGDLTVWDCERTQCREIYRASGAGKTSEWWTVTRGTYEPWSVDDSAPETILARFAAVQAEPAGDRGVRAFIAAQDMAEEDARVLPGFVLAAGADRKIRFWNTARVEGSMVVCGLDVDEPRPAYVSTHPTPTLVVNAERGEGEAAPSASRGSVQGSASPAASPKRKSATTGGRSSRSTLISLQQQQLLRNHLDPITDVAFLEVPYGMVVSVDRGGMVFVYQ